MKICLVTDYLPEVHSVWSGSEQFCLRLSHILREEGQTVSIITTEFEMEGTSDGIYQVPLPLKQLPSLRYVFPIDMLSTHHMMATLKRIKPDVIHLHAKLLFPSVVICAKVLKIPVVLTFLDYWNICPRMTLILTNDRVCTSFHGAQCYRCFENQIRVPVWLRKVFGHSRFLIFNYLLKNVDAFIALSNPSKNRLERYGLPSEKIRVIYHYQPDFKISKQPVSYAVQGPTILFVGSLWPRKGLHILLKAMRYVVQRIPDAKLLVVGARERRLIPKIESMIEELNLKRHILILGKKRNEEVLQLMAGSNVVVVPEQWANEFGPVALLEAMAIGKPVVASRIGAIPEFVKDGINGFLVPQDQPVQFAEKIVWLLQHKESLQIMSENAVKSTNFLFDGKEIEKLITLYHSLAKEMRAPIYRKEPKSNARISLRL